MEKFEEFYKDLVDAGFYGDDINSVFWHLFVGEVPETAPEYWDKKFKIFKKLARKHKYKHVKLLTSSTLGPPPNNCQGVIKMGDNYYEAVWDFSYQREDYSNIKNTIRKVDPVKEPSTFYKDVGKEGVSGKYDEVYQALVEEGFEDSDYNHWALFSNQDLISKDLTTEQKQHVFNKISYKFDFEHIKIVGDTDGYITFRYGVCRIGDKYYLADWDCWCYEENFDHIKETVREVKPVKKIITVYK